MENDKPDRIYHLNGRHQKFCLVFGSICILLVVTCLPGLALVFLRMRAKVAIYNDRIEYTWFGKSIYYWNDIELITTKVAYRGGAAAGGLLNHYLAHGRPLMMIKCKSKPTLRIFAIRFFENYDELVGEIEKRASLKIV